MQHETSEATATVEIQADPEHVWQAMTTDAGVSEWMGVGSSIGPRAGDPLVLADPVTGDPKIGVVEQVEPGEQLRYRWWSESDPTHVSQVTIMLEPCIAGTRVTVVESRPTSSFVTASAARFASTARLDWAWRTAMLGVSTQLVARF